MVCLFNERERSEIRRCRKLLEELRQKLTNNPRRSLIMANMAMQMLARDTVWQMYLKRLPEKPKVVRSVESIEGLLSIMRRHD